MGRSGGGSGRSGGGFGGGRSSGGFSGGGRSSGGFSRGGSSGGFGHRSYYGGPRYYGPSFFRPRYYGGSGCGCGGAISAIIILFAIIMIFNIMDSSMFGNRNTSTEIEKSTKVREPLQGVVTKTDWYEDSLGWISSEKVLISGLEDFYKETGIQPYVLFVPYQSDLWNENVLNPTKADDYLNKVYEQKFEDEGHFVFAYFQCQNDSKQEMEGEFRYLSGYSADTIMDNEAIDIFWGYFEANYYNTSLTIEEMISNTFTQTANNIMQNAEKDAQTLPMVLSIILIAIVVIVIIYAIVKNNKRKKQEQAGNSADIIIEKDEKNN